MPDLRPSTLNLPLPSPHGLGCKYVGPSALKKMPKDFAGVLGGRLDAYLTRTEPYFNQNLIKDLLTMNLFLVLLCQQQH